MDGSMKTNTIEITVLEPREGYVLTNKPADGADEEAEYVYSLRVYLGIHDSVSNWREIPEAEVPEGVKV